MRNLLIGGAIAAFALTPALAQTATATAKGDHKARVETRADVQSGVAKMFGRLDSNKDGAVSAAELDSSQAKRAERIGQKMDKKADNFDPAKMFARLDTSKDGKLTKTEVDAAKAARAQTKGKPQTAGKPGRGSDQLFARADANKDQVITLAELKAMPKPDFSKRAEKRAARGGMKGQLFGQADLNKDGKVPLAEAQAAALVHFDKADTNKDGKVTPDERKAARQAMVAQRKS